MVQRIASVTVSFFVLILVLALSISVGVMAQQGRVPAALTASTILRAGDGATGDMFGYAVDYDGTTVVAGAVGATIDGNAQQGAVYVYARDGGNSSQWTEISKLSDSSGGEVFDWFGAAVAVDGDVIAVGAPLKEVAGVTQQGLVYIYERDAADPDNWVLVTTKSDDTIGAFGKFGEAVALDGDRLIVGAPGADVGGVTGAGAAYIYGRNTGGTDNWGLIVKLRDTEGHINDDFGSAVDIRGETVVVGAQRADVVELHKNEGAAFVFSQDVGGPGSWSKVKRLRAQKPQGSAKFGDAVAIDGPTIVVGSWARSKLFPSCCPIYSFGEADVFHESYTGANDWMHVATLKASDWAENDFFGQDVAVSGATAVVGAPMVGDGILLDQGAMYRYGRNLGGTDNWGEIDKITPEEGLTADYFGASVAIEGPVTVVGSYGSDAGQGVVSVFDDGTTPAPKETTVYLPMTTNRYVSPNGTLVDGGVFEDSSGAVIGAVAGTLTEPLDVSVLEVTEPPHRYADGAEPVGPYYHFGADDHIYTPADKPFLIGLPVPVGANPNDLAVAILEPAELILDSTASGDVWHTTRGAYDPTTTLFSFTLSHLNPAGVTAIVVEHPDNEPLEIFESSDNGLPATFGVLGTGSTPSFKVSCGSYIFRAACTPAIMGAVESELIEAYNDFTGLGFKEPALNRYVAQFLTGPLQPSLTLYTSFYDVHVLTGPCDFDGLFHPSTQDIDICIFDSDVGVDTGVTRAIRHELFHAIQYAYPELRTREDIRQKWLREGTAAAAERSAGTMLRSPDFDLRQIRPALSSETDLEEYETQDFWVYTGDALAVTLDYLIPVFEAGAEPADVNTVLTLESAYWNYVKNQVIEKEVVFEGKLTDETGAPCEISSKLTGNTGGQNQIDFPATPAEQGALEPLSAAVVDITFTQDFTWVKIAADQTDGLKYKVYESGESDCVNVPEGERDFDEVGAGEHRYVVLANTSHENPINYAVQITAE